MIRFSIDIPKDIAAAIPLILTHPAQAAAAAAGGVREAVRKNFISLPGRSFYKDAAESTVVEPASGEGSATVSVYRRGVALRLHGGTVNARPGHAMTLPTGKSDLWPREMSGLSLMYWRKDGKLRAGLGKNGQLLFTFVKTTRHSPNPKVLPGAATLQQAAIDAITTATR